MSVRYRGGGAVDGIRCEVDEMRRREEAARKLLGETVKAQIVHDRASGAKVISDKTILAAVELVDFAPYEDNHDYQTPGEIIEYNGRYYEVAAAHTSNAAAYPVEQTFAYYRLVECGAAGTLEDPIPYPQTEGIVVNVVSGKYYSYKGETYLAKADMPNCVYPPDTPSMWQWTRVEEPSADAPSANSPAPAQN